MRNTPSFTRRQALATLAAGAVAARPAFSEAKPLFRYSMLDHLAIAVDDTEKSVRFYTRVFGNEVLKEKNGPRHYVKLGPNYIAMAPPAAGEKSQIVHHVCPGIVGFDHAATKHALDQLGLKYRESPTVGFFVGDPDATQIQLWTENSWAPTLRTAIPANIQSQGEPLIRPTAFDHALINVSNVENSIPFYEKILGPIINPSSRPRRTWFSGGGKDRVALALAGPGEKLGVHHFCLTAPFERASLSKALEAAGAKIIPGDVAAGLDFLDVNGIHVQILPPNRNG
jgi:catechol 2,3-dioxygenase-like lactoylglutathione lyase family enzyme